MAPFDNVPSAFLTDKISNLIDGQLPDFVQADHPIFSKFLKSYYQFMESAELHVTVNISNVLLEVETASNLLYEDGGSIVTEVGDGTTGKFLAGETLTGSISKATATVLVEKLNDTTPTLFIQSQQKFITGETVVGSLSTAEGTVVKYRGNPIQNVTQLLDYADVDNTIYDFLDNLRDSFLESIPKNLTTGIDRRNLTKHIRELYRLKGTKEAHKLFLLILLGEDSEVIYPNRFMLRLSSGDWDEITLIKVSPVGIANATEVEGQIITGDISGATAIVESTSTFLQASVAVVEMKLLKGSVVGTFIKDENVSAVSNDIDAMYKFIIRQIINSATVENDGSLYKPKDPIDVDGSVAIGNGLVSARVGEVLPGGVSGVLIQNGGTNYKQYDPLVFTNPQAVELAANASGFVSVINGSIVLEDNSDDLIVMEEGSTLSEEAFDLQIETGTFPAQPYYVYGTDQTRSDTRGNYFPLYLSIEFLKREEIESATGTINGETFNTNILVLDGVSGTIKTDMIITGIGIVFDPNNSVTVQEVVSTVGTTTTIKLSSAHSLQDNTVLSFNKNVVSTTKDGRLYHEHTFNEYPGFIFYMPFDNVNHAVVDSSLIPNNLTKFSGGNIFSESGNAATGMTSTTSSNTEPVLGDFIKSEAGTFYFRQDSYQTSSDSVVLESGDGAITRIYITNNGWGYTELPTIRISSRSGASAQAYSLSNNIGRIQNVEIIDEGFDYFDVPVHEHQANFIVKDQTGTFIVNEELTSHSGKYRSYDSETQLLTLSIEDVVRIESEGNDFEGIRVEDSLLQLDENILRMDGDIFPEDLLRLEFREEFNDPIDSIITDAVDVPDRGYIIAVDDFGVEYNLVMESRDLRTEFADILTEQNEVLRQEDGTTSQNTFGDRFIFETDDIKDNSAINYEVEETKIVFEDQNKTYIVGENIRFITDNSITTDLGLLLEDSTTSEPFSILLDGTDASVSNGNGNQLLLDGTDANSVDQNFFLFQDTDDFDTIAMDGSFVNTTTGAVQDGEIGDQVVFEERINFKDANIVATSGAQATVVSFDIARSEFNLGLVSTRDGSYGSDITSLIGEDLIRLQDSYYYQDFSYEIQTDSSADAYINELKRAVHPSGFNVFSKVSTSSLVSAAMVQGAVGEITVPPFVVFALESIFRRNNDVTSGLSYLAKVDNGHLTGTGIGAENGSMFSGVLLLNATDGSASNFDSTIIMEDATDENLGQSVTRDNLQAITNDFLVLDTAADLDDNILLEDAIATNEGGGRLLEEDRVIDAFTAFDIQRQSLVDVKDFDTASEFLLTEESEDGGIKLEDATTSGFNDLILEDANDLQYGGRFVLEFNRFAMEDASNDGEVPTGGFASARVEPFTRPSDIFVTDIGTISLEIDADDYLLIDHGGNSELVLDTAADSYSNILLEEYHDATGDIAGHIVLEGDGDSGGFQFQLETGTPVNISTAVFQTPERQREYSKTTNSNKYGEVFTFDSSSLNFSYK